MIYDAAWPPPPGKEPHTDGVAFYLGFPGTTPHIWTREEIHRQPARFRLPIFVRADPANADANADVAHAVAALDALGAPRGTLVAWDVETAEAPSYVHQVVYLMTRAGWPVILYGSKPTVFANHTPDGLYWAADWTNTPHLTRGSRMTQFASFAAFDLDLGLPTLPLWDTRPPTTPPVTDWQDPAMQALPTIREGSTGPAVRTAQALALARNYTIVVDGVFGPATAAVVSQLQRARQLTVDGIVGPQTWPVLMGVA
jgi:hypothetical protein